MKSLAKFGFVLSFIVMSTSMITVPKADAGVAVSLQVFYDELSPYGQWVSYPNYGYVWIPDAGADFSPYATNGHWEYTIDGWIWVSDYDWGWAAFHYGRWNYDPYYGWIWIPDTQWAPAWVVWRNAPGYYGWAPLPWGVSINVAFGRSFYMPAERWVFVRDRYIYSPNVARYYVGRNENTVIIKNTTIIKNTYVDNSRHVTYVTGPDRRSVEKATGNSVRTVAVVDNDRPGQSVNKDQVKIYRPVVNKSDNNVQRPAPRKVVDIKEVKPAAQRDGVKQNDQRANEQKKVIAPVNKEQPKKDQPRKVTVPDEKKRKPVSEPKDDDQPKQLASNQRSHVETAKSHAATVNHPVLASNRDENKSKQVVSNNKKQVVSSNNQQVHKSVPVSSGHETSRVNTNAHQQPVATETTVSKKKQQERRGVESPKSMNDR